MCSLFLCNINNYIVINNNSNQQHSYNNQLSIMSIINTVQSDTITLYQTVEYTPLTPPEPPTRFDQNRRNHWVHITTKVPTSNKISFLQPANTKDVSLLRSIISNPFWDGGYSNKTKLWADVATSVSVQNNCQEGCCLGKRD